MILALYERLTPDYCFSDERGNLVQLAHAGYRQINILESKKGVVRGDHYHKQASEAFYVVNGSLEVTLKKGVEQEQARFRKGDFFLIPPGVMHSLFFNETCTLVALYDIPVEKEDGTKDIYCEENKNEGN